MRPAGRQSGFRKPSPLHRRYAENKAPIAATTSAEQCAIRSEVSPSLRMDSGIPSARPTERWRFNSASRLSARFVLISASVLREREAAATSQDTSRGSRRDMVRLPLCTADNIGLYLSYVNR